MNASARTFSETSHKYGWKLCGNCAHVEFALTEEEQAFLAEMIGAYSFGVIWESWIQEGSVMKVGASRQLYPEKLRFVKTLTTHIRYCPREKAWVFFID